MNYIFFGSPRFAAIVLRGLIKNDMPPMAVVCNPDRPVGRKKAVTPPETKVMAVENGIPVFQPEKLDEHFIKEIGALRPDLFVVAAYAKIIPKAVLDVPRLGTIGVHPSLLPKFRGASPIQSVILAGESATGVTLYQMDAKMDHGAIFDAAAIDMDSLATNYLTLEEQLAALGAVMLTKTIPAVLKGTAKPHEQDEAQATYTKKFTTQDGFVEDADLRAAEQGDKKKAHDIIRKINALGTEPGAWTMRAGKRLKLLAAELRGTSIKLLKFQEEGGTPKDVK